MQRSASEIERWLIGQLAEQLRVDEESIDPEKPFVAHGADSLVMITIGGDLEVWLDREIPVTVTWDFPTVRQLAIHLAESGKGE